MREVCGAEVVIQGWYYEYASGDVWVAVPPRQPHVRCRGKGNGTGKRCLTNSI
jgi:hypothetical protein